MKNNSINEKTNNDNNNSISFEGNISSINNNIIS